MATMRLADAKNQLRHQNALLVDQTLLHAHSFAKATQWRLDITLSATASCNCAAQLSFTWPTHWINQPFLATTAKSARIERSQPAWASKMPFPTGDDKLLQFNQEQFDFNVQFGQLFFSIIPSALFIVTSLWRTLSQARKPAVVNAPVFQLIKVVYSSPKGAHI